MGQQEEPFPEMRRPDFGRAETIPLRSEPAFGKVFEDFGKTEFDERRYVLQKERSRLAIADDAGDVGPEVSLVLLSATLAGRGERLAREPRHEEIHASTPATSVEGREVGPNRCFVQKALGHARCQDRAGFDFPLDVADRASAWQSESHAEVEPGDAGAEGEDSRGK